MMKQTPDDKDMSYMQKRDRNGCIGCLTVIACAAIFSFWLVYLA